MSASASPRGVAARIMALVGQSGCVACGGSTGSDDLICDGCRIRLDLSRPRGYPPPPGIDRVESFAQHDGAAREIVAALKFKRRLAAAEVMAERMVRLIDGILGHHDCKTLPDANATSAYAALVPVPSAPLRTRRRGFSPAREIADALSSRLGVGFVDCLKRHGEGHQVGRGRGDRRAPDFRVEVIGTAPPSCLLIDDVYTTGGTLTACATALRSAGAREVSAVTFTRRL